MTPEQVDRIGSVLKSRREDLAISLRELEARTGVPDTLIFRLEAGKIAKPDADKLARLSTALGLTLAELLGQARLAEPSELMPTFRPYLRARYGQLPEEAVTEMNKAFGRIARKYGVDPDGPSSGEDEDDELPAPTLRRRTTKK